MPIEAWGWDKAWADHLAELELESLIPARVVAQDRDRWVLRGGPGEFPARLSSTKPLTPYPVVGDWVLAEPGPEEPDPYSIRSVLPRRTKLSRGSPLTGITEQVLAANVDVVWLVHGLDAPLNDRRLERYLAMAWESGATPVVVLTKADLHDDCASAVAEVRSIALGVAAHTVSVSDRTSVELLRSTLQPGRTAVMLGPSGVGKSTLLNALAGVRVATTGDVREFDRRGRHTTVRRHLYVIPGGALLLDSPGIRELRVWDLDEGLHGAFPDIDAHADGCRFRDCTHQSEPGCAVQQAVTSGKLDPARLESLHKLRAEAAHQRRKNDPRARAAALSEFKTMTKTLKRDHPKYQRPE